MTHDGLKDLGRLDLSNGRYTSKRLKNPANNLPLEPERLSLNTDKSFTEWNLQAAKPIRRFGNADGIPRRAVPSHLRVSRDGRFFVTARKNGRVTLWDARSGKRLTEWRELEDASYNECCYNVAYDLQVSLNGHYVVASSD